MNKKLIIGLLIVSIGQGMSGADAEQKWAAAQKSASVSWFASLPWGSEYPKQLTPEAEQLKRQLYSETDTKQLAYNLGELQNKNHFEARVRKSDAATVDGIAHVQIKPHDRVTKGEWEKVYSNLDSAARKNPSKPNSGPNLWDRVRPNVEIVLAVAAATAIVGWLASKYHTKDLTTRQKEMLAQRNIEKNLDTILDGIKRDADELIKMQYQLAKDYKNIKTDQDKINWQANVDRFELQEKAVNERRKRYFDVKYLNKPEETITAAAPVAPAA